MTRLIPSALVLSTPGHADGEMEIERFYLEHRLFFNTLFENARDAIFVKNASLRYVLVNPAMERLLGRSQETILGKTDWELLDEAVAQRSALVDRRVLQGERSVEEESFESGGKVRVFSVVRTPVRNSEGKVIGICGIAREITPYRSLRSTLQESESRFQELFENAPDLIQAIAPDGRFLYVNRAWRETLGYTSAEVAQISLADILAPECREHCLKLFHRISAGESIELVTATFLTKDRQRVEVEGSIGRWHLNGEKIATVGIYRDLRRRQQLENALRQSEERYRNIFETAAVSIWEEDFSAVKAAIEELRTQGITDFRSYLDSHPQFVRLAAQKIFVRDVNTTTLQMFGAKSKAELLSNLTRIIPEDALDVLKEEILAIAEGKTFFASETVNCALDGRRIEVLLTIRFPPPEHREAFRNVLVTLMDITDRKQIAREAERQRVYFQQLFENTPVAIAMLDTQDRFLGVNRAFEKLFGYAEDELKGHPINERIIPPELTEEASGLSMAVFSGAVVEKETVRMRKDGSLVPVQVYAAPIQVGEEIVGGYAMYVDLTDRKLREQKLEYLSSHDVLTGLRNRAYFEHILSQTEREGILPVSILVADVDGLKRINDEWGHSAGDSLLRSAAEILRACFRSTDVVARIGGDEFAVLLPLADEKTAEQLLRRLASNLRRYNLSHPQSPVHLSYGIATALQPTSLAQLLSQADRKMYEHKARRRPQRKAPRSSKPTEN
ncbi:MAG: PAS domain S-box protein [Anaerolineales bacterium]|nr:PAS domain S-box protein [Anaerolineales bacterium]MDW8161728.1 PAS domain S-box protein [Anaerolineales bacterium]